MQYFFKRSAVQFFLVMWSTCGALKAGPPATTPSDPSGTAAANCRSLLLVARDAVSAGIANNEITQSNGALTGGTEFGKARQSLLEAVRKVNDANLRNSDASLAAAVLASDAWFKGKIDQKPDEALAELADSLSLDKKAVTQYMIADLLTDKLIKSNWKDQHLRELAALAIEETLKIDNTMPEPYRLRAQLNFLGSDHEKVMGDYRLFIEYSKNIHPELFFYDDAMMNRVKKGVSDYLAAGKLTTLPTGPSH